jgi:hypothetical protein
VYGSNPGTEGNLKETIQDTPYSISPVELRRAMDNEFVRTDAYLRA